MLSLLCCQCQIASDDYDRADSADLGSGWDNTTPEAVAEIDGNTALIDNDTDLQGDVRFLTAHPGGADKPQRVRVRIKRSLAEIQARVHLGWNVTTFDRLVVHVDLSEGCVRLGIFEEGTGNGGRAQRIGESDVGEWFTLTACWFPGGAYPYGGGIARAFVTLANGKIYGVHYEVPDSTLYGEYVGIGASGPTSPAWTVRFDDFYFGWAKDEEEPCKAICPDCQTPCLIESDNFDRADSTDLGCKWLELSAVWQIVSNELKLVSGGPGIALCAVHHPQDKTHHHVTADLYVDANLKPRVIVNSTVDASSYHWAELELTGESATTLTLRIGKDGTTLATATSSGAAGFYVLTVCYDGNVLTATANGMTAFAASSAVTDGIYAGLAGNSSGSGERFDNFVFQKHRSFDDPKDLDCPNCQEPPAQCTCCIAEQPGSDFLVDLGAATLTNHCCNECTAISGEYFLSRHNLCDWFHIEGLCGGTGCSAGGGCACLTFELRIESGGQQGFCKWQLDIRLNDDPGFGGSLCGCSPPHPNGFFVRYESAPFENDQCVVTPRTLTKTSESSGPGPDLLCDGSMPSTATLRAAA